MGRIVVTEFISLDGVIEDPGGTEGYVHGGWTFQFNAGPEFEKFKFDELQASDAQLLGRVTYDHFAKAWPTMEGTGEFGERMNSMPKYVVSTTLDEPEWNNTTVIRGAVAVPGEDCDLVAGGVGDGDVEVSVAVEIGDAELRRVRLGAGIVARREREEGGRCESPLPVSERDGDRCPAGGEVAAADRGNVWAAVAVEVAGRDR